MNFDQLVTFYTVVQKKSFTEAAKELGKAKSAVSRQIVLLETRIGERLIDRSSKEFSLTNRGESVFAKTKKILLELKTFDSPDTTRESGRLRIASTHALLSTWLSVFLHRFYDEYPLWEFELFATTDPIDTALKNADICIRPYCEPNINYSQFFLRKWMLRLYASRSYIEKKGMPSDVNQLENHNILIFREQNNLYTNDYVNWPLFSGTKFNRPRRSLIETNSLHAMHNMVVNGIGIGAFAEDSPLHGQHPLIPVLPFSIFQEIEVYLIIPNSLLTDERVVIFKNFLFKIIESSTPKHQQICQQ